MKPQQKRRSKQDLTAEEVKQIRDKSKIKPYPQKEVLKPGDERQQIIPGFPVIQQLSLF